MKQEKGILGLPAIRRNRGITLEQISGTTKIGVRLLEAIENGEFRKLPGGIYNTNYIRQYARAIRYDEAALLDYYHCQTRPAALPQVEGSTGKWNLFGPASPLAGS
ncbi:MAG: helix-turn-helix domain-containing protein [Bryobacteraceae bacterium]|jgi:cytoskeletal protein RodZ